jgi:hypothetical protein
MAKLPVKDCRPNKLSHRIKPRPRTSQLQISNMALRLSCSSPRISRRFSMNQSSWSTQLLPVLLLTPLYHSILSHCLSSPLTNPGSCLHLQPVSGSLSFLRNLVRIRVNPRLGVLKMLLLLLLVRCLAGSLSNRRRVPVIDPRRMILRLVVTAILRDLFPSHLKPKPLPLVPRVRRWRIPEPVQLPRNRLPVPTLNTRKLGCPRASRSQPLPQEDLPRRPPSLAQDRVNRRQGQGPHNAHLASNLVSPASNILLVSKEGKPRLLKDIQPVNPLG